MRTTFKKIISIMLLIVMVLHILPAMAEGDGEGYYSSWITTDAQLVTNFKIINGEGSIVFVDKSITLSLPEGYGDATWESSNTDIATVANGVVTGVAAGNVEITAVSGERRATTKITVMEAAKDKATIIVQFEKNTIEYDGEEHEVPYKLSCDDENINLDLVRNVDPIPSRKDVGAVSAKAGSVQFKYDGDEEVNIIVNPGSLRITPREAVVQPQDITVEGELPPVEELQADTTRVVEGDSIEYKLNYVKLGDETLIQASGEEKQDNYKVVYMYGHVYFIEPAPALATIDITAKASVSYVDESNNAVQLAQMNPNKQNKMQVTVTGLDQEEGLADDSTMILAIPENVKITSAGIEALNSSEVNAALDTENNQLVLTFKEGVKASVTAVLPVIPNVPASKDLSGSYILGSEHKAILGTKAYTFDKGDKLDASSFTEANGKITPKTDEDPVWVLTHVTGDYYTIHSQTNGGYLYISPTASGSDKALSLYLRSANEETAQKILVTDVGNGYYSFTYNGYAINNFNNAPSKGFACWAYGGGKNEKFKLYSPSALTHEPTTDVSGTWAIANSVRKKVLTAVAGDPAKLNSVKFEEVGQDIFADEEISLFTFTHVNRDWYTISTEGRYLNITDNGISLSATPQNLMVSSDKAYASVVISNGEFNNNHNSIALSVPAGAPGKEKYAFNDNTRVMLRNSSKSAILYFNVNGGTAAEAPASISGDEGTVITLPTLDSTKDGEAFIGWMDAKSVFDKHPGLNHSYRKLLKPGDKYTLKRGKSTLYAIYNPTVKKVQFCVRKDGIIQDEPNDFDSSAYMGHFWVDNILKEGHWVIDNDPTKRVNGYYMVNNVTDNLRFIPSIDQIKGALKTDGGFVFDPETMYIHWYVLKATGSQWHVDGVIRYKDTMGVSYNMNVPPTETTLIKPFPGGYEIKRGTEITIGANKDSTEALIPTRSGYYFIGWNTEPDGSGTTYMGGETLKVLKNLNLYALWSRNEYAVKIHSSLEGMAEVYAGTEVTLIAEPFGFDNVEYSIEWRIMKPDGTIETIPGANTLEYRYLIDAENAQYKHQVILTVIEQD